MPEWSVFACAVSLTTDVVAGDLTAVLVTALLVLSLALSLTWRVTGSSILFPISSTIDIELLLCFGFSIYWFEIKSRS
jgi:hypothetical protein